MCTRPTSSPRVPEGDMNDPSQPCRQLVTAPVKLIKSLRFSSKYLQDEIRDLHLSSAAAKGCDPRSCFVRVYSFDAAPNVAFKLTLA